MEEAFVYVWNNLTSNRRYVGYHKGTDNDGYICSSANASFWDDFENSDMLFEREIIFRGSSNECLSHEQDILKEIDLKSYDYYNNARGASIIFSEEVLEKK